MKEAKFIATQELGKLAKWLRILGHDCVYYDKKETPGLIIRALRDRRILLTRSATLTKYKGIRVLVIKHDHVEEQVEQVVQELGFALDEEGIFQRCVECNTLLGDFARDEAKEKVPEYVFQTQERFKKCPTCDKIFWKGTHWDMVGKWLEERKKRQ
ncbi:MAG: Mut7-C RNAse domain-containing protein [Candidatus Omnitrophota bacterium]